MKPLDILILFMATYRLSIMLAKEDGPYDIIERIRLRIGVGYDEYSNAYGKTMLARGALCIYCNSVWIGTFLTVVVLLGMPTALILPLAASAFVVILGER